MPSQKNNLLPPKKSVNFIKHFIDLFKHTVIFFDLIQLLLNCSYDNRSASFVKFTSPGFRGPQRPSRTAGRGASRYKEDFPEEFKRTR